MPATQPDHGIEYHPINVQKTDVVQGYWSFLRTQCDLSHTRSADRASRLDDPTAASSGVGNGERVEWWLIWTAWLAARRSRFEKTTSRRLLHRNFFSANVLAILLVTSKWTYDSEDGRYSSVHNSENNIRCPRNLNPLNTRSFCHHVLHQHLLH